MPPTSAPGFRMERAVVRVAPRVLFGALSLAAPEEQASNGEITDSMCSGLARPHDASLFRNYIHECCRPAHHGKPVGRFQAVGSWFVANATKGLIVEFREQLEAGDGHAERLLFLMDKGRDGEVSSGSPSRPGRGTSPAKGVP